MRQDGRNEPKKTRKKDLRGEAVGGERDGMGWVHVTYPWSSCRSRCRGLAQPSRRLLGDGSAELLEVGDDWEAAAAENKGREKQVQRGARGPEREWLRVGPDKPYSFRCNI
jgi:hypothetical protein